MVPSKALLFRTSNSSNALALGMREERGVPKSKKNIVILIRPDIIFPEIEASNTTLSAFLHIEYPCISYGILASQHNIMTNIVPCPF